MFKKVTILILLSFGTAMSTAAATFVVPSDREMIQRCDAIIVGVASDSIATLNIYGGVETFTAFEIEEVVREQYSPQRSLSESQEACMGRERLSFQAFL